MTVLPTGTTTIPNGTTLWALKPVPPPPYTGLLMRGRVVRAVPVAVPDGVEQPALFFVEHEYYDTKPARVTATTWDGRALWSYSRSERVEQFAADNRGGVVLVTSGYYDSYFHTWHTVKRLDGMTGAVSWEYVSFYDDLSTVAIHPDGCMWNSRYRETRAIR